MAPDRAWWSSTASIRRPPAFRPYSPMSGIWNLEHLYRISICVKHVATRKLTGSTFSGGLWALGKRVGRAGTRHGRPITRPSGGPEVRPCCGRIMSWCPRGTQAKSEDLTGSEPVTPSLGERCSSKAVGATPSEWMVSDHRGDPIHPHSCHRHSYGSWTAPTPGHHARRAPTRPPHPCSKDRIPIKVVTERLGHSNPAYTLPTYQQSPACRSKAVPPSNSPARGNPKVICATKALVETAGATEEIRVRNASER